MTAFESESQVLDPLTFPLHGSRLIEASAGTGKTFTIALLYVRLILGHEPVAAFPRLLSPRDILVVTFTEAATKELRDRIRTRLAGAAAIFRENPDEISAQPQIKKDPIYALRQTCDPAHWGACARRLELAAESMDEAAVHTIHSWCYRMLREHAFDSGGLFAQNLETDHSDLLLEVVRDYWRTFVYPLSVESTEAYLNQVGAPEKLLISMRPLMDAGAQEEEGPDSPAAHLEPVMTERRAVFEQIRAGIPDWITDFEASFKQAKAAKNVDGRKIRIDHLQGWLAALQFWADLETLEFPGLSASAWRRLSIEGITEAWKVEPPVDHPLIKAIESLDEQRQASVAPELYLRHAAWWCARRMEAEKQRRGEMGFDDLLTRLDQALQSPAGSKLAETIRSQFPVGLIDEFQDTDPVQYRIFETVFQINTTAAEPPPASGFFMIGDPKQAIYGFRGADIHTYLSAREATAGRHYTLATNYRSASDMVAASNHLFAFAETSARQAQGAFGFGGRALPGPKARSTDKTSGNPLPFYPVSAKGRPEALMIDGVRPAAMTIWQGADIGNTKADSMAAIAHAVASEITRLLNLGLEERAGFKEDGQPLQPLCAADIAILVNNGQEARAVRQALFERDVRSVYLSDRASVLATAAAGDVLLWLRACSEPERERWLRAALATGTLGLSWSHLDHLRRDELAWEAEIEVFRDLRQVWQRQGVLAMIRRLLSRFDVPARLLTTDDIAPDGERVLTDLLHIAELLQRESQHLDGEHALVRHFSDLLSLPRLDPGSQQVRLESDESLVQVVTVHKSKGLEYPLVFLPFATACRPVKGGSKSAVVWHDDTGAARLTYDPDDQVIAKADQERLGEDIRKLYVALTRARHATWVGACALDKNGSASAMAYLVGTDSDDNSADDSSNLEAALATMASASPAITLTDLPEGSEEACQPPPAPDLCEARTPTPRQADHWWIASYSAIRYEQEPDSEHLLPAPAPMEPETANAERMAEDGATLSERALPPLSRPSSDEHRLHRFYRGAGPGTFLHNVLEWAAEQGFSAVVNDPRDLQAHLQIRCAVRGWAEWGPPLSNWTLDYLQTPLPLPAQPDSEPPDLILSDCQAIYPEMEFWFATSHADVARIDQLVRQKTLDGRPRPQVQPMQFNGMLKGFIDLVLEHNGRYYVMDYKSNYLGPGDEDYTNESLAAAIAAKRYDLQYVIYLLALHRLLRSRLPGYDYDQHIGGAVYSFLRGNGATSRGIFAERPPKDLIESLDNLMRGQSAAIKRDQTGEVPK